MVVGDDVTGVGHVTHGVDLADPHIRLEIVGLACVEQLAPARALGDRVDVLVFGDQVTLETTCLELVVRCVSDPSELGRPRSDEEDEKERDRSRLELFARHPVSK